MIAINPPFTLVEELERSGYLDFLPVTVPEKEKVRNYLNRFDFIPPDKEYEEKLLSSAFQSVSTEDEYKCASTLIHCGHKKEFVRKFCKNISDRELNQMNKKYEESEIKFAPSDTERY